jgi:hypothetical protein
MKGPRVSTYFGADVDGWERTGGVYQDVMVGVDAEGGKEVSGVVIEVDEAGDEAEEVGVDVLFL